MNIFTNKRAEIFSIVLIIIVITIALGWLVNINSRECRSNSQCPTDNYCGSDFSCHQIPTIEKTIIKNNLLVPSIILGLAIIIAATVLRFKNTPFNTEQEESNPDKAPKNHLRLP